MGQFIIREEPGEVNWSIRPQILPDPSAHFINHLGIVI
jgi:hypothetical protein